MEYGIVKRRNRSKSIKLFWVLLFVGILLFGVRYMVGINNANNSPLLSSVIQSFDEDVRTEHEWNLILVNQEHKVSRKYNVDLIELSNGQSVDSRIYPSLQEMFDDMRAEGIYPTVASGYRTTKKQKELMDEKVASFISQGYSRTEAKKEAKQWVAAVGYSEHETGLAVDINADCVKSTGTQVYDWLFENAWRYGFILRYPANKVELTGIAYEPWHYRYVGTAAATEIYEQEICLEEYIDALD